jgi:hypothetical protein
MNEKTQAHTSISNCHIETTLLETKMKFTSLCRPLASQKNKGEEEEKKF